MFLSEFLRKTLDTVVFQRKVPGLIFQGKVPVQSEIRYQEKRTRTSSQREALFWGSLGIGDNFVDLSPNDLKFCLRWYLRQRNALSE
jgi:hypothetical protein